MIDKIFPTNWIAKVDKICIWAPVTILYIWVVAILMVLAFGGALSLSRVSWKSAYSRSFHACIFLSMCINFLSCSFHVPFNGIHFHSFSNIFQLVDILWSQFIATSVLESSSSCTRSCDWGPAGWLATCQCRKDRACLVHLLYYPPVN